PRLERRRAKQPEIPEAARRRRVQIRHVETVHGVEAIAEIAGRSVEDRKSRLRRQRCRERQNGSNESSLEYVSHGVGPPILDREAGDLRTKNRFTQTWDTLASRQDVRDVWTRAGSYPAWSRDAGAAAGSYRAGSSTRWTRRSIRAWPSRASRPTA